MSAAPKAAQPSQAHPGDGEQATLDAINAELERITELLNDPAALRRRADKLEREALQPGP